MIDIQPHADGSILPVRAQPGSQRAAVRGEQNGMLKVSVTVAAEKGKANRALIEVLCDALDLRRSQVELLSGSKGAAKRFLVLGIGSDDLRRRVQRAIGVDD